MMWNFESYYEFKTRLEPEQQEIVKDILQDAYEKQYNTTQTINMLRSAGVSYQRKAMLYDINKAFAIERAKTEEAYKKAEKWFESIEQLRKDFNLRNRKEAIKLWKKWQDQSFENIEDIEIYDVIDEVAQEISPGAT